MRKAVRRILILLLILVAAIAAFLFLPRYLDREKTGEGETLSSIPAATLPVVYSDWNGIRTNVLNGYTTEMDLLQMRDVILPVGTDHVWNLHILPYGSEITHAEVSLYSLDGQTYLADQEIQIQQNTGASDLSVQVPLSVLMEDGAEYQLILTLSTTEHEKICYYSRVISQDMSVWETLYRFAEDFSLATLDKETAREVIVPYMDPTETAQSTFSYADLNSSFATLTWGTLSLNRSGTEIIRITELSDSQMTLSMEYTLIGHDEEGSGLTFNVEECYVLRQRQDKQYILRYNREASQPFAGNASSVENDRINFGVQPDDAIAAVSSSDGVYTAFSCQDALWLYDSKSNQMIRLFTWKGDLADERNDCSMHTGEILEVCENGDVYFLIYGYMNRGSREGQVGTGIYAFNYEENTIRECAYIPSEVPYSVLKNTGSYLHYVNDDMVGYLLYGTSILSFDLDGSETQQIADGINPEVCYLDNGIAAWQETAADGLSDSIQVLNMKTGEIRTYTAESGDYYSLQGFLAGDLVYTIGHRSDLIIESGLLRESPYYAVRIMNPETGEEEASYERTGVWITEIELEEERAVLSLAVKNENGELQDFSEDALILNESGTDTRSTLKSRLDEQLRTVWYLSLGSEGSNLQFSGTSPSWIVLQNPNTVSVKLDYGSDSYRVYEGGELSEITDSLRKAVQTAYDGMGIVFTADGKRVWDRETRALSKDLSSSITVTSSDAPLAAGVELLISGAGAAAENVESRIASGEAVISVLRSAVGERALDLSGCILQQMTYYLNRNRPVLAAAGDGQAVLLTGYTSTMIRYVDLATGEPAEQEIAAAAAWFAESGNRFYTVRPE